MLIVAKGNGGDIILRNGDAVAVNGFQNSIFLALFGGNVQGSTKPVGQGELRQDWWANELLYFQQPTLQMNSETERTLREVALNSQGLRLIQQAVIADLTFMRVFSEVSVSVALIGTSRVQIIIRIERPTNDQESEFTFLWDQTLLELSTTDNYETI